MSTESHTHPTAMWGFWAFTIFIIESASWEWFLYKGCSRPFVTNRTRDAWRKWYLEPHGDTAYGIRSFCNAGDALSSLIQIIVVDHLQDILVPSTHRSVHCVAQWLCCCLTASYLGLILTTHAACAEFVHSPCGHVGFLWCMPCPFLCLLEWWSPCQSLPLTPVLPVLVCEISKFGKLLSCSLLLWYCRKC